MGRKNYNTFLKKQRAEQKRKKQEAKRQKKEEKKSEETGGTLEDMIAYVDKFGNIVDEPPEEENTDKDKKDHD